MKMLMRLVIDVFCFLLALAFAAVVRIFNVQHKFDDFSVFLAYIPFVIGERTRYYFYKMTLQAVGRGVRFKFGSWVQYRTVEIADNVLIGYFTSLGECKIGSDVLLGGNVSVMSGLKQHNFKDKSTKIKDQGGKRVLVLIGDDVYVGTGSIIGANLAEGSVVAAGSVIVADTEAYTVYAGLRAQQVSKRTL